MKLTTIILFATTMLVSASLYSQSTRLTLNFADITYGNLFQKIEEQSEFRFAFSSSKFDPNQKIRIDVKKGTLEEILNEVLPEGVSYDIVDRYVVIHNATEKKSVTESQQQKSVKGRVTDTGGQPLPGVSVVIKGTTNGTITDADGNYLLVNIPADAILQLSFVGMKTREIAVAGKSVVDASMSEEMLGIEEVVAIGYGTMKKSDLTGSISSVTSADLEKTVITTPDQAMQGRVAGVQVRTDSHAPGGSISVQVRGTSSLSASGQPLYVVDGFPISNEFVATGDVNNGDGSSPNPLNSIDPSNIESIEVLKDASATAIYGSRATNGVVLITTKRGTKGNVKVDFESTQSVDYCSKYLEIMTAPEWAAEVNEACDQNNKAHTFTDEAIAAMGKGTDWQREIFRTALSQKYKMSVSGGTNDVRYLVSTNYSDQNGIVTNTNFKRYSTNINLDANLTKKLTIGSNVMFTNSVENILPSDTKGYSSAPTIVTNIFNAPLHVPVKDADGNYTFFSDYVGGNSNGDNPLYMVENYDIVSNTTRLLGSLFADYKIAEGLDFKVRVGMDYRDWRYKTYYPLQSITAKSLGGSATQISEKTLNILNENILEYKKTIAEKHQISVMAGFTYQTEKDEYLKAIGYGFPSDYYKYNNMGLAKTQSISSQMTKWTLMSYIGRVNYTFNNKYLFTATARYDGSSKFGANNKYGFFPSFAGAWRMSEENFIKSLNFFSNLKLRVGYGNTGNERIGLYNSVSSIATSKDYNNGYVFGGTLVGVAYPNNISNPDLSWEKSRDINMGFDVGIFGGRLNLTFDAYKKKTTDLLLSVSLPTESGYSSVLKNVGSMENKGIEISIQTVNVKTNSFMWTTNLNYSMNRNKILDLGGASQIYTGWVGGGNSNINGGNIVRLAPGKPVGAFYGVIWEGIWKTADEIASVGTMKTAKPGYARLKDFDKSGTYDANDCTYIGDPNPDFIFGFNNDFSYKQWSLGIYTYGEVGQDVAIFKRLLANGNAYYAPERRNRWTPTNINGTTIGASAGYPAQINTDEIYDASYLRVKTIVLNYSLPVKKMNINWLSSAKVSVAADNLFTLTKYPFYDPEVNSFGTSNAVKGVDRFAYPASKGFRLGVSVSF